jgi:Predicted membrane protein
MSNSTVSAYRDTRLRSILKAISWRCTGTLDTFCVSFVVLTFTGATEGNKLQALQLSGGIAAVEVVTKIVLYYLHERVWMRIRIGRPKF